MTNPISAGSSGASAKRRKFAQLTRTPWVPERLLQEYGAFCAIDSRFRRAARMLQILWMRDRGIPNAIDGEPNSHLGSYLRADAAEAGQNFLTPSIHLLALREMLLREENAAIDEDRLISNSLSSMPLVFNAFGPMAIDTKLATKVFRQLLPHFVHSVESIAFEHSPGRREDRFLADRSAFDVAVLVKTPEGGAGIVYVEVKYTEDMAGPAARWRDRYDEALKEVRLYKNPDSPILRSAPIEQLMREHALAQLAVDNGIIPRAMFIAIGPRLNRRANAAFVVYANELLPIDETDRTRVAFQHFTLEALIDSIDVAGDQTTADALWQRYCNFHRVYDAALSVLAPNAQHNVSSNVASVEGHSDRDQASKPQSRRRASTRANTGKSTDASATEESQHG